MLLSASLALITSTSATSVTKTYDINVRPPANLAQPSIISNISQFDERTVVPALPELNAVGVEDGIVCQYKPPAVHTYIRSDTSSRKNDTLTHQLSDHLIFCSLSSHSP